MFRRTVPAALKGVAGRVLAHAQAEDGTWVAATPTHLVTVGPDGAVQPVPWHRLVSGGWDRGALRLSARLDDGTDLALAFPDDAPDLVQVFHERVGASVVLSRDVPTRRGPVLVAIRKDLSSQDLFDVVVPPAGVDVAEPGLAREIERVRQDMRDQVGLPL